GVVDPDLWDDDAFALAGILEKPEDHEALRPVDLWKLAMGSAWDEMTADGVPFKALTAAGLAAVADFQYDRDTAIAMGETGGDPKAIQTDAARK
ncbi:hypothetical protein ACC691_38505, partial [Rhizobium johnstonii]|uniref:DUF7426 family protein n=1 Tax=Rhizobium johnstonii TaxID=3019933 RepID=UPI003F957D82